MFLIVGPTAVGKTGLAVAVAAGCDGEIVGADAFQVYEGMSLVTAKPEPELLAAVPHHLIGTVPRSEAFDVARYLSLARAAIADIERRGKAAIVAGGTGLYVRALTHGLAELPSADPEIRSALEALPLPELRDRLLQVDPAAANIVDLANRRRVVRALEVHTLTGQPFSRFRENWNRPPLAPTEGVLLVRDAADLAGRIERRTRAMFDAGMLEEVRTLHDLGPTAEKAIGISEARACLRGEITREEAGDRVIRATRKYAKRQMTWFRREPGLETVLLAETGDLSPLIQHLMERTRSSGHHAPPTEVHPERPAT